jgi:hypothetical protein
MPYHMFWLCRKSKYLIDGKLAWPQKASSTSSVRYVETHCRPLEVSAAKTSTHCAMAAVVALVSVFFWPLYQRHHLLHRRSLFPLTTRCISTSLTCLKVF